MSNLVSASRQLITGQTIKTPYNTAFALVGGECE